MQNDSSFLTGCLVIIVGIFLFVLVPIVLLVSTFTQAPLIVKVTCISWMLFLLLCFSFIKDNTTKFSITIIVTLFYAIEYCSWYAKDVDDENVIGTFCVVYTMLVPFWFFGSKINKMIVRKKQDECRKQIFEIEVKIQNYTNEINKIEASMNDRKNVLKVVKLINACGGDTSVIEENSAFSDIEMLTKNVMEKKHDIKLLTSELEFKKEKIN